MNPNKYFEVSNYYYKQKKNKYHEKNIVSKKEEKIFNLTFSLLKICLLLLAFVSLTKIGHVTQLRLSRLKEIKYSYNYEKEKFIELTNRLDDLLSHQGEQRFMKDQDQMISRDVIRVIWR